MIIIHITVILAEATANLQSHFNSKTSYPQAKSILDKQFELQYHLHLSPVDSDIMSTYEVTYMMEKLKKRLEDEEAAKDKILNSK